MFNKNLNQKISLILLPSLVIFGFFTSLYKVDTFAQNFKPKDKNAITNCEIVENRLNRKIDSFIENKKKHLETYQKSQNRSQAFLDQAVEQKLDTIQLENDLKTLNEKINEFIRRSSEYQISVEQTRNYSCSKPENEFKNSLNQSRQKLIEVTVGAQSVRNFFQTDIIPDIESIKSQIK